MTKKREGFKGQRALVLPNDIRKFCKEDPILSSLYLTDIGYYPRAQHHFRKRPKGANENILIYCIEGKGTASINNEHFLINPHDYLIIPEGIPNSFAADEHLPWSIYWIHYKGTLAPEFNNMLIQKKDSYVQHSPYVDARAKLFHQIINLLESGYGKENLINVLPLLQQIFFSLVYPKKLLLEEASPKKEEIEKAIEYMKENVENLLTLEEMAKQAQLSISHFSYTFKQKTGYTPINYFNHLKIQKACQYLQFTDWTLKRISSQLGFEDAYYFSRLFKKHMGYAPNFYRKSHL
ncbi:AraC family transcriptional regulator [Echinicola marina]|uniref:helix-turn-helix domain-containing protein n=1 Tax=Echinicola marina TaxID=2859768 RepID=UPI001CF69D3B|nr:AraC family transcriptional regulator [Echinicola marina]UCS91759.1 AraC family transcriptional regulator [Echinicola marina]